ncbi:hypothetical protein FJW06_15520 [Mesorhizobium sp. B4-1-3]|uniref:hypothetical protein n=1 Tax=Mesorhizobium sp. B4-1-3 TaxID=2589889 RepID=UPI00112DA36D|nr:hypothetical protein [Mesorhizobium sp. B4-1-3]TPI13059.1 hypothetical protein FJW06_15520 [Mesorhizobium sp. B4-1-3]
MVSFAADIKPLFDQGDIDCMTPQGVILDDYAYMSNKGGDAKYDDHANASHVYARLAGDEKPRMPKGGPFWTQDKLDLFKKWMDEGYAP